MAHILILEDDVTLGEGLKNVLGKKYQISLCPTLTQAQQLIRQQNFDLIILDLGLPDGKGTDLMIQWPKEIHKPPVLILSAQGDPETRLLGFELGVDDFVPKPFHLKELQLRIEHIFKNHPEHKFNSEIKIGNLRVSFENYAVYRENGFIEYPPVNDLKILQLLYQKSNQPVSRDEIINHVWGIESETSHRTVDNSVARIRQMIGDQNEQFIRSIRGIGYLLEFKK